MVLVAVAVASGMLLLPWLLAPKRRTAVKAMPYESGMDPVGDARGRFDVRFYLVALVFLLFDVELLFLYPWAVAAWSDRPARELEQAGAMSMNSGLVFGEVMLFVALLAVAYVYAWRRRVFEWK
jgi:NADH-quinone oxidoreductase subunit A